MDENSFMFINSIGHHRIQLKTPKMTAFLLIFILKRSLQTTMRTTLQMKRHSIWRMRLRPESNELLEFPKNC